MDKLSQNIRGINNNNKDSQHISSGSDNNISQLLDDDLDVEVRPIRRRDAVEAGLDYWIDDGDLERERQRRIAVKNRKVRSLHIAYAWNIFL